MAKLFFGGVPSSAGGNSPGMEYAPQYLRSLGITDHFEETGIDLIDLGDLPINPFKLDPDNNEARNVDGVLNTVLNVKDQTLPLLASDGAFFYLGGDCTISLGVIAAATEQPSSFGVLYIDAHTDLNHTVTHYSGILDGTGVAHMFGYGDERLLNISKKRPMMDADQLIFLGCDPEKQELKEQQLADQIGLTTIRIDEVKKCPMSAFKAAAASLAKFDQVFVHVDIDVLEFKNFPIANVPEYVGAGLLTEELESILCEAFRMKNFKGCMLTEINPDRDKKLVLAAELNEMFANAVRAYADCR